MAFEQEKSLEVVGEKIGFLGGYFLFTTVLFYIFSLTNKLPDTWSYRHIMLITIGIVLLGIIIKRALR